MRASNDSQCFCPPESFRPPENATGCVWLQRCGATGDHLAAQLRRDDPEPIRLAFALTSDMDSEALAAFYGAPTTRSASQMPASARR
jgi:hypothetical protein